MTEIWKAAPGHPDYDVSNLGRVRLAVPRNNRPLGHIMRPKVEASNGYLRVSLSRPKGRKTVSVHRLVALAFLGEAPSNSHEVAHRDGNPANNHLSNLRWATKAENQGDRVAHGTHSRGERHPMVKLTKAEVIAIRHSPRCFGSGRELAQKYNVTPAAISAIRKGKLWSHVQ